MKKFGWITWGGFLKKNGVFAIKKKLVKCYRDLYTFSEENLNLIYVFLNIWGMIKSLYITLSTELLLWLEFSNVYKLTWLPCKRCSLIKITNPSSKVMLQLHKNHAQWIQHNQWKHYRSNQMWLDILRKL